MQRYARSVGVPILILAFICLGTVGTGLYKILSAADSCPPDSQATVEDYAHLKFPPSVSKLDCGYILFQGSEGWAKFEMSPDDLDAFVESTMVGSVSRRPAAQRAKFRYDISAITNPLYGEYHGIHPEGGPETFLSQYILIDTRDPHVYVVYFGALFGD